MLQMTYVRTEMDEVAEYFGKKVLREVDENQFWDNLPDIKKKISDRAALRAIHFFCDNYRAKAETEALKNNRFEDFLTLVNESGDSLSLIHISELATMILEDAGLTVTRASDGKEVVDLFKNHPRGTYDLILMDIMMPNMDGHQAAKAIRALGIERSDAVTIPIIALSANAFIDDIQESLDSGMNDHISKPINMEELIDTITKYIKHD